MLATDISGDALEVTASNVARLGLQAASSLRRETYFSPQSAPSLNMDVLVSNPPYVPSRDIPSLAPEISRYEPRLALDGGPDGLDFYRRIAEGVSGRLTGRGFVALEVGDGQAAQVTEMLEQVGLIDVETTATIRARSALWSAQSRGQGDADVLTAPQWSDPGQHCAHGSRSDDPPLISRSSCLSS